MFNKKSKGWSFEVGTLGGQVSVYGSGKWFTELMGLMGPSGEICLGYQ